MSSTASDAANYFGIKVGEEDLPPEGFGYFGVRPTEENSSAPQGETVSKVAEFIDKATDEGSSASTNIRNLLISAGINPDSLDVQLTLAEIGETDEERYQYLISEEGRQLLAGGQQSDWFLPTSSYDRELAASGFKETYQGEIPSFELPDTAWGGAIAGIIGELQRSAFENQQVQFSEQTGYQYFPQDGVLVTDTGQVVFDPAGNAPGSTQWLQSIQQSWSESEILSWRKKLSSMGYLPETEKKGRGWSEALLTGLQQYHMTRYRNGGNEIPLTNQGGGKYADQPLFDYTDIRNQVSNSVATQLEHFYGTVPNEVEVKRWTQYIIEQASDLQRKFRAKDVSSYSMAAYTEAEESFINDIRQDTAPMREAVEENTSLRDSLRSAAAAADSFA